MLFGSIKSTLSVWRVCARAWACPSFGVPRRFFLQQQQQVASKVFSFKCFGDGIFWCHFIRLNTCAIACINFARPFVVANVGNRAPFTLVPLRFSMENLDVFVRSFVFIFLVHTFSHTKIYVEFDKDKMACLFRSFHVDWKPWPFAHLFFRDSCCWFSCPF